MIRVRQGKRNIWFRCEVTWRPGYRDQDLLCGLRLLNPEYRKLNTVRKRVNLSDVTSSGTALRDAIRKERRLELALENNRLYDLRRWTDSNGKKAIQNLMGANGTFVHYNLVESTDQYETTNQNENSNKGYNFTEGRDELFPIPNSEIIMSDGSIKQNPNY